MFFVDCLLVVQMIDCLLYTSSHDIIQGACFYVLVVHGAVKFDQSFG